MCTPGTFKIHPLLVAVEILVSQETLTKESNCWTRWALFTDTENSFSVQELVLPSDPQVQLPIFFFLFLSAAQQNLFSLKHDDPQFQLCCLGRIQQNILYFLFWSTSDFLIIQVIIFWSKVTGKGQARTRSWKLLTSASSKYNKVLIYILF